MSPKKAEHIPTLQELTADVAQLRERIEALEDSKEIDAAIRRNGDEPLVPWEQAKKVLGLRF